MYRLLISSVFLVLTSFATVAQNNETDPYIEVTGSAEMEVTPDIIIYTVILREYEKDRKLTTLKDIETRFLKAVNASGIEKKNINISDVSAGAFGSKRKRKAFASKTYNLTFSDPVGLLSFTDRLENLDIDNQRISKLTHSKLITFRLDVKKQALLAAKNKAEALLSVVDSQLGKALLIREISNSPSNFSNISMRSNRAYSYKAEDDISNNDIGFKKIKLRFEIMARFQID